MTAMNPWIETAVFDAIMQSKQPEEIRFVQVLQRKSDSCVVISDCKTRIECKSCYDDDGVARMIPTNIQRGSVAKLENYKFVTDCNDDPTAPENNQISIAIELMTNNSMQFSGAQGMGIIGDPIDIKGAVQVRRALQHIQNDVNILNERFSKNVGIISQQKSAESVELGSDCRSRSKSKTKRGDALALLQRTEEILDKLMRQTDDADLDEEDNDDYKTETQDLLMTQECKATPKRKEVASESSRKTKKVKKTKIKIEIKVVIKKEMFYI